MTVNYSRKCAIQVQNDCKLTTREECWRGGSTLLGLAPGPVHLSVGGRDRHREILTTASLILDCLDPSPPSGPSTEVRPLSRSEKTVNYQQFGVELGNFPGELCFEEETLAA